MSLEPPGLTRYAPLLGLAAVLLSCGGAPTRDANPGPRGSVGPGDSLDPTAYGISDLARTSRYVFRVMGRSEGRCATHGLPPGRWEYTIQVEVRAGRVTSAGLAEVSLTRGAATAPVPPDNWPLALQAYVGCLRPQLLQVVIDPAPPDGVYPAQFMAAGAPDAEASGRDALR